MKINTQKLTDEFLTFLENLNPQDWNQKVTDKWTIRDMIVHLIGWEKEAVRELPISYATHQKPWFMNNNDDYVEFNAKNVQEYKDYPPKQLIEEWKKWQKVLDDEVEKIGVDKLKADYDFFEWVFDEGEGNHYLEHFKQIKEALNIKN